ncbi:MAG: hypothetical protein KA465_02335 [Anaerolineaceae bacterium]|nr:hypothetical protein [Anaerolineaceae bacterium]
MLRKHCNRWLLIVVCVLLLSACIPYSFSPPVELHINPGDEMLQAQVAMDTEGVSHIVGVVDDRIVYYRTRYGEPIITATFTMSGSGTDWKQYSPEIAVTDSRTAYLVWIEQRGGPEKFACWRNLTYIPPIGGWTRYCNPLDGNNQTTGNVRVVARGDKAYAVYDRMDLGTGRISELLYKELSSPDLTTGRVYSYTDHDTNGFVYSLDLGIDSQGFLHVGFHDNIPDLTPPPDYTERVSLHSTAQRIDGDMLQHWFIAAGAVLDESIPVSLSFYNDSSDVERVVLADGEGTPDDLIYVDSCVAVGCTNKDSHQVDLPSSWDTYSVISDIEILGIGQTLHLSFIGLDNTTIKKQVYYMDDAFSSDPPINISHTEDTQKLTLEMTPVVGRDPDYPLIFPATAWMETDFASKTDYFVFDGLFIKTHVFGKYCDPVFSTAYISSNGIYFSGVWVACYSTWFSTQAWTNQLPLIMK